MYVSNVKTQTRSFFPLVKKLKYFWGKKKVDSAAGPNQTFLKAVKNKKN